MTSKLTKASCDEKIWGNGATAPHISQSIINCFIPCLPRRVSLLLAAAAFFNPEDGSNKFSQNIRLCLSYTVLQPRKPHSS
jgi:hypothetical protein